MKTTLHVLKHIVFVLICSGAAHGQEGTPSVSNVQITLTCWNNELEVTAPGLDIEDSIIVPAQSRSEQTTYSGSASFRLSQITRNEAGEIGNLTPVAQINIPLNLKKILIILIPSNTQSTDLPYRAIVINDDYEIFPLQSVRFLNFTHHRLAGQLGDNQFKVEARGEAVSKPTSTKGPKHLVPFRMMRYIEENQLWRPVRSTVFSIPENMRILVIMLDDPGGLGLRFVMLRGMEINISQIEAEDP